MSDVSAQRKNFVELAGVIEKEMFWYFRVLVRFIDVIGLFSKQAAYWMYGLSRTKFRVFLRAGP
jgi:hypothetical protein